MSKRRRSSAGKKASEARFWGPDDPPAATPGPIRPTPAPAAMVRSLGAPPLAVAAEVADRHLGAVYEEAVRAATALAAVNGLLAAPDEA
ncbi:MAG TPA: hypothetical protein VFP61_12030 [Acidimicrobiales bacterium]|nr:hypothetical protein [Acidimicrobiales bacterium]